MLQPDDCPSGGRSDVVTAFVARLANAAARTHSFYFGLVTSNPNSRWEDTDRDAFFAFRQRRQLTAWAHGPLGAAALGTLIALRERGTLIALRERGTFSLLAVIILRPLVALRALAALRAIIAFGTLVTVVARGPIGALRAFAARFAVMAIAIAARRGALLLIIVTVTRLIVGAGRFLVAVAIFFVTRAALILFLEA